MEAVSVCSQPWPVALRVPCACRHVEKLSFRHLLEVMWKTAASPHVKTPPTAEGGQAG